MLRPREMLMAAALAGVFIVLAAMLVPIIPKKISLWSDCGPEAQLETLTVVGSYRNTGDESSLSGLGWVGDALASLGPGHLVVVMAPENDHELFRLYLAGGDSANLGEEEFCKTTSPAGALDIGARFAVTR